MPYRYVPILKTKAGEAVALENLPDNYKDRILPLFRIGESSPSTFSAKMQAAWFGRSMALDGTFNFNFSGSVAHFNSLFSALVAAGIPVMPSIEVNAPATYLGAVQAKVGTAMQGLMLRTSLGLLAQASSYANTHGWPTQQIDLLVEVGHIAEFDPHTLAAYVQGAIAANVAPGVWRSVALSSSSAPKDFGDLASGTNIVPRRDWALWSSIAQPPGVQIDYSDYGQSHIDLSEPPGYAMARATVSVRYACPQHWVMIKGRATTGAHGIPMGSQYKAHAVTLQGRTDFGGVPGCWADGRIGAIAAGTSKPGGRSQWVEIGTNRHLALVANTLP